MANLKVNTVSGIGTEGPVLNGGLHFRTLNYMTLPKGTTTERGRGRGIISRGMTPSSSSLTKIMQYIDMSSGGNSVDFGDGMDASYGSTAVSSSTRGVTQPGATANSSPYSITNRLDYVTIATTASAQDFGDLLVQSQHKTGLSNQTRGIFAAGFLTNTQAMDKIEIATLGDATDFGDSIGATYGNNQGGQAGSTTRGLIAGGSSNSAPAEVEKIQFVTFSTLGDAQDFGDLVDQNGYFNTGASSQTRAVFAGGIDLDSPYASTNTVQYVKIATTGDAIDFGDLTVTKYGQMGMSNSIRGYFAGGVTIPGPTRQNIIDFVTISTTGNAVDSGDLDITSVNSGAGISDSHGGVE